MGSRARASTCRRSPGRSSGSRAARSRSARRRSPSTRPRSRSGCRAPARPRMAKHFPGVGSAAIDTDNKLNKLRPTRAQRDAALIPYRSADPAWPGHGDALDRGVPRVRPQRRRRPRSRASLIQVVLRHRLGSGGSRSPTRSGRRPATTSVTAGVLAARAGADILLYTDSAPGELRALEAALAHGQLPRTMRRRPTSGSSR